MVGLVMMKGKKKKDSNGKARKHGVNGGLLCFLLFYLVHHLFRSVDNLVLRLSSSYSWRVINC
jgi:hypothetical protein